MCFWCRKPKQKCIQRIKVFQFAMIYNTRIINSIAVINNVREKLLDFFFILSVLYIVLRVQSVFYRFSNLQKKKNGYPPARVFMAFLFHIFFFLCQNRQGDRKFDHSVTYVCVYWKKCAKNISIFDISPPSPPTSPKTPINQNTDLRQG